MLSTLASGDAMASYALSEREAGSDPASMRTRARAEGDDWVLNGAKCWITNGGRSTWYTVMAVTDRTGAPTGSRRSSCIRTTGFHRRHARSARWASRARRPPSCISRTAAFPATASSAARHRVQDSAGQPRPHAPDDRRQAVGIAQGAFDAAIAYTKERKQFADRQHFQGVQFMLADMAMKVEAARLMVYTAAARAERGERA